MMKLSAVSMAYNDEAIIKGTLRCLKPFVDKHIVMLSEKPFYGEVKQPDRTEQICNDEGAIVIKGFWEEHKQRNIGIQLCSDSDWVICFDSDEMMTTSDMTKLIKFLEITKFSAIGIESKVYWKTTDYKLSPNPDHKIIIAVRPQVRYWDKRNVDCSYTWIAQSEIVHHHLSWSAPKDIYQKVTNCNHANEFDGEKWYKEHFTKWKFGEIAVEPFGTRFNAVYDPLPQELKEFLI